MALLEVKVPNLGDFKDVEIIEVHVRPGDAVKAEAPLITLETDKAAMPVPHIEDKHVRALEAAMEGQGVAIVPTFLAAADLRSGRLVAPFALDVAQPRRWYLVCRRERSDDERVRHFRDWLHGEVATDAHMAHRG